MQKEHKNDTPPLDYDYLTTASAMECTGLIPKAIEDEEEIDNYAALYPFLPIPPTELK